MPVFGVTGRRVEGIAVPVTISTASGGQRQANVEWWKYLESSPGPKVVVAFDRNPMPGSGAACGRLTAHVLRALGCIGYITNGYIRDPASLGTLSVFAAGVTLRHGDPHVVSWGEPVTVGGMRVSQGDWLVADEEGAIVFPRAWLQDLPAALGAVSKRIDPVLDYCRKPGATAEHIARLLAQGEPTK
ncbi:MAG: hypothetical protein JNL98_01000 [Bryobacterales bacterium]|nr:hypothetical protein [Bryobacterales bacterium]